MTFTVPFQPRRPASQAQYVRLERRGGLLRASVVGPHVGQRHVPVLADEIAAAIDAAGANLRVLVLDLQSVHMMTGVGLGMCVSLARQARSRGARTIVRAGGELGQLFRMLKLDHLCTIVHDESALALAIAA